MIDFEKINLQLHKLPHLIQTAITHNASNEAARKLLTAYQKIITQILQNFDNETCDIEKLLHFATIYGLTRAHLTQFRAQAPSQNSISKYAYSLYKKTENDKYFDAVLDILKETTHDFDSFCQSGFIGRYIDKRGHAESLTYHLGSAMLSENNQPSSSLLQLEKRILVLTYFEFLQERIRVFMNNTDGFSMLANLAVMLWNPFIGLATLAVTYAKLPAFQHDYLVLERSLQRVTFQNLLSPWTTERDKMLSDPAQCEGLIADSSQRSREEIRA